jgi:hypothetical protein
MALDAYQRELAKLASSTPSSPPHFRPVLFQPNSLPNGLSAQDLSLPKRGSPDIKVNEYEVIKPSLIDT